MRRALLLAVLGFASSTVAFACGGDDAPGGGPDADAGPDAVDKTGCLTSEPTPLPAVVPHTARWAYEPWISKDISTRDDTYAFVDGFQSRDIPVGAVVLDSPWETNYNTFVPNPTRYGDFAGMVNDMHAKGVKVVTWITMMVNESSIDFEPNGDVYPSASPNFDEGTRCDYYVDHGDTFGWWKGKGAAVDFFNPGTRAWWHAQQDVVLDVGLDGWKLDFAEQYHVDETFQTIDGPKSRQEYSERYYQDYLAYGRQKRGADFVTMVRAWDVSYQFDGRFFARREDAPVAWMGDNRRDYVGLVDALDEMFVSAAAGYPMVGSDIGGYLDHDDHDLVGSPEIPFDTENFARWVAVGALSPFMQLHGKANITPWTVPDHVDETVALYKYWATLHHQLVPYFYSLGEDAWAGDATTPVILRPIGDKTAWAGDYRYTLGESLLVAPLLDATGKRDVALPAGSRWYDWWTAAFVDGGTTVPADFSADRAKVPLYLKEGGILPMVDEILVWPGTAKTSFVLRELDESKTTIEVGPAGFTISALPKATTLEIVATAKPTSVTADGTALATTDWTWDDTRKVVSVPLAASPAGKAVALVP